MKPPPVYNEKNLFLAMTKPNNLGRINKMSKRRLVQQPAMSPGESTKHSEIYKTVWINSNKPWRDAKHTSEDDARIDEQENLDRDLKYASNFTERWRTSIKRMTQKPETVLGQKRRQDIKTKATRTKAVGGPNYATCSVQVAHIGSITKKKITRKYIHRGRNGSSGSIQDEPVRKGLQIKPVLLLVPSQEHSKQKHRRLITEINTMEGDVSRRVNYKPRWSC